MAVDLATQTELDRFTQGFRDEHREARDVMLDIAQAFRDRNPARVFELMGQLDAHMGAHMQYEELVMYPELAVLYGGEYIENMVSDHDRGLGMGGRLAELAQHEPITDGDIAEAEALVQRQLPHVTDCDGLVLAIEVLPAEAQPRIFAARDAAIAEGLSMMQWGQRRGRAPKP